MVFLVLLGWRADFHRPSGEVSFTNIAQTFEPVRLHPEVEVNARGVREGGLPKAREGLPFPPPPFTIAPTH